MIVVYMYFSQNSSTTGMDYVYEVLSKKTADRTEEDIGECAVHFMPPPSHGLWCIPLLFSIRSCDGCLAVHASKSVIIMQHLIM